MTLEITSVWNKVTPELEAELTAFWLENKAMVDAGKAAGRAAQVVCIARGEDGKLAGVSTAYPRIVPLLRQPMYYYRNYLSKDYRGKELSIPFLQKSREVLQEYCLAMPKPLCIGIILSIENQRLAAHYNSAHWPRTGFTFIGYSADGHQLRVSYFDGVRLHPPAQIKKRAAAQQASA